MSAATLLHAFTGLVAIWIVATLAAWHLLNRAAVRRGNQRRAARLRIQRHALRRPS